MKRVSSRQRLVSWDAFDATNNENYSSEGEYSDYDANSSDGTPPKESPESSQVAGRKRERVRRSWQQRSSSEPPTIVAMTPTTTTVATTTTTVTTADVPTTIPSFAWEISPWLQLDDLIQDVHLHIFSFLDIKSVRQVMGVSHKYRQLLFSAEAHNLWLDHCQKRWNASEPLLDHTTQLVDLFKLPTAAGVFSKHDANLPLLLSLVPEHLPTEIDKSLLGVCNPRSSFRGVAVGQSSPSHQLKSFVNDEGDTLVQYTGPIGSGDRCIRSNNPFPRPKSSGGWKVPRPLSFMGRGVEHPSLFDLLCRGARAVTGHCLSDAKPFVAPYVSKDGAVQFTPRMVAYYEVSIMKDQNEDDSEESFPPPEHSRTSYTDCVAVGLATESFHVHSRMPGWDCQSFGYHGDDGGIFHCSGGMVERFGPCFGAGDTVGCGIDYVTHGIFFTLNGEFLGYGWKGIHAELLQNDLYPVVGIDTNASVSLNFGSKPFQYDLAGFTMKHEELIAPSYKFADHSSQPEKLISKSHNSKPHRRFRRRRAAGVSSTERSRFVSATR